jgi:hypothetical protein
MSTLERSQVRDRVRAVEKAIERMKTRDALLTPPTAAELAAAGAAVYEPTALGKVWNGLLETITGTLDSLDPADRAEIVRKMQKYSAENWKTDASGATNTRTGDRRGVSDGARKARANAELMDRIADQNRQFAHEVFGTPLR